jgi:hypothetical protein
MVQGGADVKINITNPRQISKILNEVARRSPKVMGREMYINARRIMNDSKKMVPVDTGWLRYTGYVTDPEERGFGQVMCRLGYYANYALYVHEGYNRWGAVIHPHHVKNFKGRGQVAYNCGGQAKFLEIPYYNHRETVMRDMGEAFMRLVTDVAMNAVGLIRDVPNSAEEERRAYIEGGE